jgi:hypothetical protein
VQDVLAKLAAGGHTALCTRTSFSLTNALRPLSRAVRGTYQQSLDEKLLINTVNDSSQRWTRAPESGVARALCRVQRQ